MNSLLELIEQDRRAQCEAILAEAEAGARAVRERARAEARLRVREAFVETRERAAAQLAAARAQWQTQRRVHAQRLAAAWLAVAWRRLPEALGARWRDPGSRRQWTEAVAAQARTMLAKGAWQVVHAADWPPSERDAWAAALPGCSPGFHADPSLQAGLRVAGGANVVDATLAGLLADREEIGAQLLAALGAMESTA